MCGIVGVCRARRRAGRRRRGSCAMRDAMRHRGPDDEGLWQRAGAADVGARPPPARRSSTSATPAASRWPTRTARVQVTFNGEIYNHEELRARARAARPPLPLALRHRGARPPVRGARAGAWSTASSACSPSPSGTRRAERLVRSPATGSASSRCTGSTTADTFAFASEIKALLPLLARREIDPTALRALPDLRRRAAAAHAVRRRPQAGAGEHACSSTATARAQPRRYWDPLADRADFDGADDRLGGRAPLPPRALDRPADDERRPGRRLPLRRRRLVDQRRADEPARRRPGQHVLASASTAPTRYNEFDWARRVAEQFGTDHHEVAIGAAGPVGLPARARPPPGRADRRPRVRAAVLRGQARQGQRRHGRARRRGRGRAVRGLPDLRAGARRSSTRPVAALPRAARGRCAGPSAAAGAAVLRRPPGLRDPPRGAAPRRASPTASSGGAARSRSTSRASSA